MNAGHNEIDLGALQKLMAAATDTENVWRIRVPSMPWKVQGALLERASLISKLEATFPHRAIWLSDWASDGKQGWRILASHEHLSSLDEELKNGAWALFFYGGHPELGKLAGQVPSDPPNATAAIQSVKELGASAAIWSWYDNYEWLLVLPTTS